MEHILIIEDDTALSRGIELALGSSTRHFTSYGDLHSARQMLNSNKYDLIILDINLPDGSGFDFCVEIRQTMTTPILFLTANDTELDIVAGLESGGDDYITKPFSLAILRARVNTLLRRNISVPASITIDSFHFDFETMRFYKGSELIEMSKTEQRLLKILIDNKGQTLTRTQLLEYVWQDGADYVDENALSVTIRRLRNKLEDSPSSPQYIKTIYGIGYTWGSKSEK